MKNKKELLTLDSIPGIVTLGRVKYNISQSPIPPHTHESYFEITYHITGKQTYTLQEKDYLIRGGDIFLSYPHEVHGSGHNHEDKSTFYYVIFSLDGPFLNLSKETTLYLKKSLYELKHRHFKGNKQFKHIFDQIIDLEHSYHPLAKPMICSLFTLFFFKLLECAQQKQHLLYHDMELTIAKIKENPMQRYTIAELAIASNLSPSRFQQKFREYAGVPPMEFVMREKIEYAKHLLNHTHKPITEIALELGFSSSQHFASTFRKYQFLSPRDYRKRT